MERTRASSLNTYLLMIILKYPFSKTWLTFLLASIPVIAGSVWATVRTTNLMSNVTLAEWAILTVSLTVVGCISQLGMKPGYMQEVTDIGKSNRIPALMTATLFLSLTGLISGGILVFIFFILYKLSLWENIVAVCILPLHCILTNAVMMFHTDLRILGKASLLAWLSIIQIPIFIFSLEICLSYKFDPLASFFFSGCCANILLLIFLIFKTKVSNLHYLNINFLKRATYMGLPVMGGLLSKYSCDMVVVATFRWALDNQVAGAFGIATRLCEPLMAVYIGSFQMAWGAHVYQWIKESPTGYLVNIYSNRSWLLVLFGLPIGLLIAISIWSISFSDKSFDSVFLFVLMLISRIISFGISSSMGFGQTMQRSYKQGLKINVNELLLTLILVPVSAVYFGVSTAMVLCGVLPWVSVFRIRNYSKKVLLKNSL